MTIMITKLLIMLIISALTQYCSMQHDKQEGIQDNEN